MNFHTFENEWSVPRHMTEVVVWDSNPSESACWSSRRTSPASSRSTPHRPKDYRRHFCVSASFYRLRPSMTHWFGAFRGSWWSNSAQINMLLNALEWQSSWALKDMVMSPSRRLQREERLIMSKDRGQIWFSPPGSHFLHNELLTEFSLRED